MTGYRIGDVSKATGLSVDTLRYYERIGLLQKVNRTDSGIRRYGESDLASLGFIQRAQQMNFSLSEIGTLLELRKNPNRSRKGARRLARAKLDEIDARLRSLEALRRELGRLVESCRTQSGGCAILSGLEGRVLRRGNGNQGGPGR